MKNTYLGWTKSDEIRKITQDMSSVGLTRKGNIQVVEHDYKYYQNGNAVICTMTNQETKGVGIAKCHPRDNFNLRKGLVMAELRATADFYTNMAKKVGANYGKTL